MNKGFLLLLAAMVLPVSPTRAERRPVLPQIELPHPYYYRELYLPQLTSGPTSLTWSPDSRELAYSMAGSLWRQKLDAGEAVQLTDGPGYDYQPDWSPDGKRIVYVSYQKDALELWLLDVESGRTSQLTTGGAVNIEPRWSPDGKRIVFVSSSFNKRFHIFRADVGDGKLENVVRLTGETRSDLPRYYYSQYDVEISPVWTRDGQEILFVSNRGHIQGTGGFWRMKAEPGAAAREIHYEETSWKARPDFSPDGSRLAYSSYLGRQWHNLWVMPAGGGDAFPISYGDWDETGVRWSPDGRQIAFVSNQSGSTRIGIQNATGAARRQLAIPARRYLGQRAPLLISLSDDANGRATGRVFVTDSGGRSFAPENSWVYADDGFDRKERPMEAHYFYAENGHALLDVPVGAVTITVVRGYGNRVETRTIKVPREGAHENFLLRPLGAVDQPGGRWVSADLHVHRNYGGTYKNAGQVLKGQAEGEGLELVNNLAVNKEQRFPDVDRRNEPAAAESDGPRIIDGQEFHTSYWGHR
ncbi:MAG TPA: DPP IV N-terminal domain-containing protein, partial [Candidatus Acidoferrum sp.]|nr:DPP IV N-terminal domain-containing protein [Candidatus Acidoferrum sp.]